MNPLIDINKIIMVVGIIIISFCVIRMITYAINRLNKYKFDKTIIYIIRDIIEFIIYIIAILIILDIFGINLTGILVSLGIGSLILTFAAKDIISNIMSGLILLSDQNNIKIDDNIEINNNKGIIREISFRNTKIETDEGFIINIPNSTLTSMPYTKFKKIEHKKTVIPITLPLEKNITQFEEEILKIIKNHKEIAETPKPHIETKGIDENGTLIKIFYHLKEFKNKEEIKLEITKESRNIISKELNYD